MQATQPYNFDLQFFILNLGSPLFQIGADQPKLWSCTSIREAESDGSFLLLGSFLKFLIFFSFFLHQFGFVLEGRLHSVCSIVYPVLSLHSSRFAKFHHHVLLMLDGVLRGRIFLTAGKQACAEREQQGPLSGKVRGVKALPTCPELSLH
mmetsp:Transcript_10571/g.20025  ORF Transcript_10571/g.20025 Transcript_10571/m.20025 type:complete len:150 (-) Transcript_10571:78-527(-)